MGIEFFTNNISKEIPVMNAMGQSLGDSGYMPMLFDFNNSNDMMATMNALFMQQLFALSQLNKNYIGRGNANPDTFANISSKDVFNTALNVTLKFEGGYSNQKNDRGGATNFGITQSTYNSWCKRNGQEPRDVRNITKEEVKEIYYKDYWVASGANKVSDPKMAIALFDSSVLHGVSGAKKIYQKSGGDYRAFLQARRNRYDEIVDANPSQRKFLNGWRNRVDQLA